MPEAKASGFFFDGGPAFLNAGLALDLLILRERQQQAIRGHYLQL